MIFNRIITKDYRNINNKESFFEYYVVIIFLFDYALEQRTKTAIFF